MPLLAGLLGSLFGSLVSVFAEYLGKKVAMGAAAIAVMTALTVALTAALAAAASALVGSVTLPALVLQGMAMFMPGNLPACVAAVLAAEATAALYRWNRWNLVLAVQI